MDRFKGLSHDIISGFSVFLLALPLCLGIAMASNFPPAAGIMTAIVGGMVASLFGGARLSIKGPAAGLIVIVLASVHQLGEGNLQLGYERTLAVGVVAALIQLGIAYLRKAVVAEIMPPAVIHGMLTAIGVIIISKQAYVMMGVAPMGHEPFEMLMNIPQAMPQLNPLVFGVGLIAITLAIALPLIKKLSALPSSLVILSVVIPLSLAYDFATEHTYNFMGNSYPLSPKFLIALPHSFFDAICFPDFSVITSFVSIKYIIMFSLVGSIESLLTVCAIDSMTQSRNPSDLNRDLMAVGVGNLVSSLAGGLPMISEIVRSKANIDYGATSAKSNFFHGLFMLLAVFFFPHFLNLIPLSALAAILVFVGFKLASPHEFKHFYQVGRDQFAIFMTTFIVTLTVDLLMGVAAGILLKVGIHMLRGHGLRELFSPKITVENGGDTSRVNVEGPLTFVSYLKLKTAIQKLMSDSKIGEDRNIIVNLDGVTYLDHTTLQKLPTLRSDLKGPKSSIEENQTLHPFYKHPLSARGKKNFACFR